MDSYQRLRARLEKTGHSHDSHEHGTLADQPSELEKHRLAQKTAKNGVVRRKAPGSGDLIRVQASFQWPYRATSQATGIRTSVIYHEMEGRPDKSGTLVFPNYWTYLSAGLSRFCGNEILFSIRSRKKDEPYAFPRDPMLIFDQLYDLVTKRNLVPRRWEYIKLGQSYFGRPNLSTVAFVTRDLPSGLMNSTDELLPSPRLHAIMLTNDETAIADKHGLTRVLIAMGHRDEWFPCPIYTDLERRSVFQPDVFTDCVRERHPNLRISGLSAYKQGRKVYLEVPLQSIVAFKEAVANIARTPQKLCILDSSLSELCDSAYLWNKEGDVANCVGATDHRKCLALSFLGVVWGLIQDAMQPVEDGFIVMLSQKSWVDFQNAVQSSSAFDLKIDGWKSFHLTWSGDKPTYLGSLSSNPTITYRRLAGTPPPDPTKHTQMAFIVFIKEPLREDTSIETAAAYTKDIEVIVAKHVPKLCPPAVSEGYGILVDFSLPRRDSNWMMLNLLGLYTQEAAQAVSESSVAIWNAINDYPIPSGVLYRGEMQFQLYFSCYGYEITDSHINRNVRREARERDRAEDAE